MPLRDGAARNIEGLEALKRHREKRKTKAAEALHAQGNCSTVGPIMDGPPRHDSDIGTANETPSFRTEASSHDFAVRKIKDNNENLTDFIQTIVTTSFDREKMRKISMLGLEHPADRTSRQHRESQEGVKGVVVATEESIEAMRKISILGQEDPVDRMPDCVPSRDPKTRKKKRQEKRIQVPNDAIAFVEATDETHQLMRMMSVLDMSDPVYGDMNQDMDQVTTVFDEDRDFEDVPSEYTNPSIEGVSEHTDSAQAKRTWYLTQQLSLSSSLAFNSPPAPMGRKVATNGSMEHPQKITGNRDFEKPVGSFHQDISPSLPISKRSIVLGVLPEPENDKEDLSETSSGRSVHPFIPLDGSFRVHKAIEQPKREVLLKDIELSHQVQSMFPDDALLLMSASSLKRSLRKMDASLRSVNVSDPKEPFSDHRSSVSEMMNITTAT
jgi:hypothetical protein